MKKIGIQGVKGSFHHQFATSFFEEPIEIVEHQSFSKLVYSLKTGVCDQIVMAIENSVAGSILSNYALLDDYNLNIIGEGYQFIELNLFANKKVKFDQIKEVFSHPMALLQCRKFFEKHQHIKLIEYSDTASALKMIKEKKLVNSAALAGQFANQNYQLDLVVENLQSINSNATRFVVIDLEQPILRQEKKKQVYKSSLKFELKHHFGSLATVLSLIGDHQLNLTKIQSLPIKDNPWNYMFYVDMLFESFEQFEKAIEVLKLVTENIKLLGVYPKGNYINSKVKNKKTEIKETLIFN